MRCCLDKGKSLVNENQMQQLLQMAAQRINTTPEALKAAAESGNFGSLNVSGNDPKAQALRRVLSDPQAAQQLLSTPAAQKLMQALGKQN